MLALFETASKWYTTPPAEGRAPKVGRDVGESVQVGKRIIRFDGEKIIFEDAR